MIAAPLSVIRIDAMLFFFKQKGARRAGCALFIAIVMSPFTMTRAQTVLTQWSQGTLQLKLSPDLRTTLEPALPDLAIAAQKLQSILGQKAVPRPLVIWLLKTDAERDAVLQQLGYDPAKKPGRTLRSQDQVIMVLSPMPDKSWISRYILTEYARYVLMTGAPEDGMEWFRTGMAISLGWYVQEEIERGDWSSCVSKLEKYYRPKITDDAGLTVKKLSVPGAFKKALVDSDRSNLMARSVLLYVWCMKKRGPAGGVTVLNIWERERDLRAALDRGADTTVDQLDAMLAEVTAPAK